LALYDERIRNKLNYKIFVHCDDDVRLCRRIIRDVEERGREVEGILFQYNVFVKGSFDEFVQPTMSFADIVIPSSRPNQVAIRFIA
jgi:uridine kinase